MALVRSTTSGYKYLEKIPTLADYGAITSSHLYSMQLGLDGATNRTFTLPRDFALGSDTLMIFVNGEKAIKTAVPTTNRQYLELTSKTVQFGAALLDTDIVEFYVAGTWLSTSTGGEGGSGTLNSVYVASNYTMLPLDRALVDSRVAPIAVTLPANPVQGDICEVVDAGGNAETNNITVSRNAKNIQGSPDNIIIDSSGVTITFIFIDETYGWKFTVTANTIGQLTGFRQYYRTTALEGQTFFTLPFNVNLDTKNITVHIDGTRQIIDLAFTLPSSTSVVFSEPLLGGENIEFESLNASTVGDLVFNTRTFEGIATEGQTIISFPFDYVVGAKNLSLYINGNRVSPSNITEVTETTIEIGSPMIAGDVYMVESVETKSYGVVPVAENANKLNNVPASEYLKVLPDIAFYLSPTGDDTNGTGTEADPWQSISRVIEFLKTNEKFYGDFRVILDDGVYAVGNQLTYDNRVTRLCFEGKNIYDRTFVVGSYASLGNDLHSAVLTLNSLNNIEVNDYVMVYVAEGNLYASWITGCHKVTSIDSANSQITVEVWYPNATPLLNLTTVINNTVGGSLKVIKAVLQNNNNPDTSMFLVSNGAFLYSKNIVFDGSQTPNILIADKGTIETQENTCAFINSSEKALIARYEGSIYCPGSAFVNTKGVEANYLSRLVIDGSVAKNLLDSVFLTLEESSARFEGIIVWGALNFANAMDKSYGKGFFAKAFGIQDNGLYCATSQFDIHGVELYYVIGDSFVSHFSSKILANSAKLYSCGTEIASAFWGSFIQMSPATLQNIPGYTTTPAINTVNNGNSYILATIE